MITSDLIIIGAGPGGYETAVEAARLGMSVTIIEARHLGGTCLNVGCIPTKCLAHAAEVLTSARRSAELGVTCQNVEFSLAQAVAHKDAVVAQLTTGIATLMKSPGITLVEGKAEFRDAHTVVVGDSSFTAPHIIIATGSSPKRLPIEGATLKNVVTSDELLSLTTMPKRLCVIGGGVIGLELASIFNTFGAEVSVLEFCKEILPNLDKDMAKRLRTALKKQGVSFSTDSRVKRIVETAAGCTVSYDMKGKDVTLEADLVLMAVGRTPNLGELSLEKAGVEYSSRGIIVNENMQTNVDGVYAIGDVNGLHPLAHAAVFQGRRALHHMTGVSDRIRFDLIPSAVYTSPQLATVGLREEDFTEEKPIVHKAFYRANGRAMTMDAADGFMKILADASGCIKGVHILGEQASELIHEATALMNVGADVEQLKAIIHAHPTLSELYTSAALM